MGRRIEIELTSTREDGSWTWRAAGARQPKGDLGGSLLYDGAKVGDVVKAEAEFHVDGIEVTEVFPPKQKKERSNLLEMKSRQFRDDELVTTQRVSRDERRSGGRRGNRRDRGERGDRNDRRGGRRNDGERNQRSEADARPKPKRLRPRRAHREALLADVGDEHRPIVEQVIKDGMPGVRAAIEKQNAEAKAAGKPEIEAGPILSIAEKNLNKARLAEWRDRADAALADAAELDLRDLRSVVVSGNDIARDDESREIAEQLKTALDERVESDHATWLSDMETAINDGRVVRALRLSSRPVKAGAPLPPELASTLAGQASEALAADVGQERWATVLDALAYSPVRGAVTPAGLPSEPKDDLIDTVKRLSDRIPAIAGLFGIDPAAVPKSAKRRRPARRDNDRKGGGGRGGDRRERAAKPPSATKSDRPVPGAEKKAPEPEEPPADETPTADAEVDASAETVTEQAPDEATTAEAETTSETKAPEAEAPDAAATAEETPAADAPEADAPDAAATAEETPAADAPEAEAPDAAATAEETPAADAPEAEAPDAAATAEETPAADDEGAETVAT
ncbi:MAG: hypothetical protein AAGD35_05460 [Actinomycetota bacterium]